MTEEEYIRKISLNHRKKYAQFFTPEQISDFMASWVLQGKRGRLDVLEPAFGLGVFSRSMCKINPHISVLGYDVDETIFGYANDNFASPEYDVRLVLDNYLTASWSEKFDGIICNPPYFKFQDYDNATLVPMVNAKLNTHLNGFTNIYTLFLLKSIFQMKEGGRMAYIVPSEFLNSDYGVEVKRAILQSGVLRHVIIVDFTQCAFDDALTTACILFCEKDANSRFISFSKINNVEELTSSLKEYVAYPSNQLDPEVKWKRYYEDEQSSKYNNLVPFSTFAKVSRGIATGANDYFTFKPSKIDEFNIPEKCFLRCICHAADVQTQVFTEKDFENAANHDKTVYLFNGCVDENESHVRDYIALGENLGVDKKYLTASRTPWYALENRQPSPIWVSVFNRNGLRFVRNKANAYNLTTFHCVYNVGEIDTEILFAYLVTGVAKEILLDNSRQYGNGLVKFEPNDLNKGNVLDLRLLTSEEKRFVRIAAENLQYYGSISNQTISILDDFFRGKFVSGHADLESFLFRVEQLIEKKTAKETKVKTVRIRQLNFFDLFEQFGSNPIFENSMVHEDTLEFIDGSENRFRINPSKNCLIGLVKEDNIGQYADHSAKIYYTGKKFPSTVILNNLYYFMPYLKGKGVRDLYIIKVVRVGTRKEGQNDEDKKDFRLVFEIEFVKQLFDDYKQVELKIWRTFTDTTIEEVIGLLEVHNCL